MKTCHWTLAAFTNEMDNCQWEDWWVLWRSRCDLRLICSLDCCMNRHFSTLTKFSHQSIRVNYFLSCLTLWLMCQTYMVTHKGDTQSHHHIRFAFSVFHNIPLQSSHRQEWSLHKHIRICSIQVSSSLIVQLTVVDKSINCFYIKK